MSDDKRSLYEVMEEALRKHPHLRAISEFVDKEVSSHVREGTMTLPEALARIRSLSEDKTFNALVQQEMGDPEGDLLFQEEENQQPGLNPLLLGQIMERLQFDGDVPEMRSGHMLEGGTPAVPVDTNAVNPIALGVLLTQASEEVAREFDENAASLALRVQEEMLHALEAGVEASPPEDGSLVVSAETSGILGVYERPEVDPKGYARGQLPALRGVSTPSGSALASLSVEAQHEMAWKALATTQGRRSSLSPIQSFLLRELFAEGLTVTLGTGELLVASHEWVIRLDGPQATQVGFSPAAVARAVLSKQLLQKLPVECRSEPLLLSVQTVDNISQRLVGWSAQLYVRSDP